MKGVIENMKLFEGNMERFEDMSFFIGLYFGMDRDLYGHNPDELTKRCIEEEGVDFVKMFIDQIDEYIKLFCKGDEESDTFFDKHFGCNFLYKNYYINSGEFLRNVLGKLIFYRDQRLQEEAAAKKT